MFEIICAIFKIYVRHGNDGVVMVVSVMVAEAAAASMVAIVIVYCVVFLRWK